MEVLHDDLKIRHTARREHREEGEGQVRAKGSCDAQRREVR